MQKVASRTLLPFLPIWRAALSDKSGATFAEFVAPHEQQALGQRFNGVTVLTFGASGLIDNVALHYRPLGAVLAFSAEMGRRLGDSVGPGVFYQVPQAR